MKRIISFFKRLFGKKTPQVVVKTEVKIKNVKEVTKPIVKAAPVKDESVKSKPVAKKSVTKPVIKTDNPITAKEIKAKVKKPATKKSTKKATKKATKKSTHKAAPKKSTPKK